MRRIAILSIGLLAALPAFSQTAPAPRPAGAAGASGAVQGPHPKSKEENNGVVALFKAPDPDSQIKAAEDFLKTFPDSDYKGQALLIEAEGYHGKRDETKAIALAEQSLAADPTSYATLLLLGEIYSRTTRATDLDMNEKVGKAEKYAKEALDDLAKAAKPAAVPDADWTSAKKSEEERAYTALGFCALLRKKYDDAKTNFDKAMELNPNPLEMLYIERGYGDAKRYDDAIAWIDKATATPGTDDRVKQIAASDKTRFQNLKKQQTPQQ